MVAANPLSEESPQSNNIRPIVEVQWRIERMGPLSLYDLSSSTSLDKVRPGGNDRSLSSQKSIPFRAGSCRNSHSLFVLSLWTQPTSHESRKNDVLRATMRFVEREVYKTKFKDIRVVSEHDDHVHGQEQAWRYIRFFRAVGLIRHSCIMSLILHMPRDCS